MSVEKRGITLELQARREIYGPSYFYPDSTHKILRSYLYTKCIERTNGQITQTQKKKTLQLVILSFFRSSFMIIFGCVNHSSGPSCSKLTMSLVNDLLKFTSSDTQIC